MTAGRPSATAGGAELRRFARVAVALWLASAGAMLPAWLIVFAAVAPALGRLPDRLAGLPPGELAVIVRGALAGSVRPLEIGLAAGAVLLWCWRVLWRAGMTSWRVWAGGRRVRLGELLALGLTRWWRVARVHMVGLGVTAVVVVGIGAGALTALGTALTAMDERALVAVVVGAAAVLVVGIAVCRAATAAGVWRLARPDSRSALLAWLEGLGVVLRHPVASGTAVLLWSVVGLAPWLLAGAALVAVPGLGATPWGVLVAAACGLASAAAAVALMGAFAPVCGLLESGTRSAHTTHRSGPPATGLENG